MSQPRPNADQAPRRFSASARSSLRWCWNSAVSGVCLGAESEGHHNNGERRFRVEQRTSAGGPPDDALAPIPAVRALTIGRLKSTQWRQVSSKRRCSKRDWLRSRCQRGLYEGTEPKRLPPF
jgi:hypothetical protein